MRILNTHTTYRDPSNLFTEEEQREQCCEPVSVDPCVDVGKTEDYNGKNSTTTDYEARLAAGRSRYPGITIESLQTRYAARNQPCGKKYTRWSGRKNCCDEVEPIQIDYSNSDEVYEPFDSGIITITGGIMPLAVSVRGKGFYLSEIGVKSGQVNGTKIRIVADDACGPLDVYISDGCTIAKFEGKCTEGYWHLIDGEGFSHHCGASSPFWETKVIRETAQLYQGVFVGRDTGQDYCDKHGIDYDTDLYPVTFNTKPLTDWYWFNNRLVKRWATIIGLGSDGWLDLHEFCLPLYHTCTTEYPDVPGICARQVFTYEWRCPDE